MFRHIDSLLRGELKRDGASADEAVDFPLLPVVVASVILAAIFGACIGSFTAVSSKEGTDGLMQLLASTVKMPLLFYLTLIVTFPSLYVFNALMGSRLNVEAALKMLVAAIAVMVSILASLGPIIVFFAFSTPGGKTGHRFILLLVVALSTAAGVLGLNYLLRMLHRYTKQSASPLGPQSETNRVIVAQVSPADSPPVMPGDPASVNSSASLESFSKPPDRLFRPIESTPKPFSPADTIFRVWVFVFAIVGAQMSWVLRPFIGSPDLEFSLFRERSGNFFQAIYRIIMQLLQGE
jgi:hypothetical protein